MQLNHQLVSSPRVLNQKCSLKEYGQTFWLGLSRLACQAWREVKGNKLSIYSHTLLTSTTLLIVDYRYYTPILNLNIILHTEFIFNYRMNRSKCSFQSDITVLKLMKGFTNLTNYKQKSKETFLICQVTCSSPTSH